MEKKNHTKEEEKAGIECEHKKKGIKFLTKER